MNLEDVIKRPLYLTEKSTTLQTASKYLFEVDPRANKIQIKNALQTLFGVGVIDVNTLNMRGKDKRMGRGYSKLRNWKKAIVTLHAGHKIEFFEGV